MIRNLQVIRETFGSECLVRPIQLNDMILDRGNQGSDTFMFSGNFFQIMPFRDRLGRRIVVRSGETITARGELDYITRVSTLVLAGDLVKETQEKIRPSSFVRNNSQTHLGFPLLGFSFLDKGLSFCLPRIIQRYRVSTQRRRHSWIPARQYGRSANRQSNYDANDEYCIQKHYSGSDSSCPYLRQTRSMVSTCIFFALTGAPKSFSLTNEDTYR